MSRTGACSRERIAAGRAQVARPGRRVIAVDLLVIAVVPAVIGALFLLPMSSRARLILAFDDPTLLTAYASHFVHLERGHLLANLLGYVAVITPTYLLCLLGGFRRGFYETFVTVLLAFPFALSALTVALGSPLSSYGFSGLAMAFLGFLPVALFVFLGRRIDPAFDLDHSPLLFFAGAGLIAVLVVPDPTLLRPIVGLAGVMSLSYLGRLLTDVGYGVRWSPAARDDGPIEVAVAGLVVFAGFPVAAFPPDPVVDGVTLNLYVHLLGFAFGFIVPYLAFRLLEGPRVGRHP